MSEQQSQEIVQKVNLLDTKFNNLNDKLDMVLGEMRDRDNQRHAELIELRARQDEERREANAKFDRMDAKFERIDAKLESSIKHVQTLTVAALVGMGAMFLTLVVFIFSK